MLYPKEGMGVQLCVWCLGVLRSSYTQPETEQGHARSFLFRGHCPFSPTHGPAGCIAGFLRLDGWVGSWHSRCLEMAARKEHISGNRAIILCEIIWLLQWLLWLSIILLPWKQCQQKMSMFVLVSVYSVHRVDYPLRVEIFPLRES